jgi:hypothetical protein
MGWLYSNWIESIMAWTSVSICVAAITSGGERV